MGRRIKLWLLAWREDWIQGQIEVVEQQIHDAPIRRKLLHERLRRVRAQLAQATPAATLLQQALARRAEEIGQAGTVGGSELPARGKSFTVR